MQDKCEQTVERLRHFGVDESIVKEVESYFNNTLEEVRIPAVEKIIEFFDEVLEDGAGRAERFT